MSGLITLPFLIASLVSADPVVIPNHSGIVIVSSGVIRHTRTWPFLLPVLQSLAQVPIIVAVFAYVNRQQVRAADALLTFMRRIGPVVGVSMLQNTVFMAGLAVLVVPGIIAWTILYVAMPACVGEQCGIVASLKRSAALTRDHRWKILGLAMATGTAVIIPTVIAQQLAFKLGGATGFSIVEYLLQAVYVPFNAIVSTLVYQALRTAKEGSVVEVLSEVFA